MTINTFIYLLFIQAIQNNAEHHIVEEVGIGNGINLFVTPLGKIMILIFLLSYSLILL